MVADSRNHLPMALVALEGLGGDEERLREFAAFYEKRRRPKTEKERAASDRIAEDLAKRGSACVLADLLPRFTPGIGAAAFHGLIRTAYAVDSGDDTDLPDALRYWTGTYRELRPPMGIGRFATAAAAFEAIRTDDRFGTAQHHRMAQSRPAVPTTRSTRRATRQV